MERRDYAFAKSPDPYWNVPKRPSKKAQVVAAAGMGAAIFVMAGALPVVAGYCTSHIVRTTSKSTWGSALEVKQVARINQAVQKVQQAHPQRVKTR